MVAVLLTVGGVLLDWSDTAEGVRESTEIERYLEVAFSVSALVALGWRRRRPVLLALVFMAPAILSIGAAHVVAALVITVAVHRRWIAITGVFGLFLLATVAANYYWYDASPDIPPIGLEFALQLATMTVLLAIGLSIRARRVLVASLRERAERAEAEQQRAAEAARFGERHRIAREMHDSLAHRLSLIALHAGALEYRRDVKPEEVATEVGVIRESARQALLDLREVIGVLRADSAGHAIPAGVAGVGNEPAAGAMARAPGLVGAAEAPGASRALAGAGLFDESGTPTQLPLGVARPQPGLADLEQLVAESTDAGLRVRLSTTVEDTPSDTLGRTVYRVVQEGLTNARKHGGPGVVTVEVTGTREAGLRVDVRNPLPVRTGVGSVRRSEGRKSSGSVGASGAPGLSDSAAAAQEGSAAASLPGSGVGLIGLAERTRLAGGRMEHGVFDDSFRLRVWLPWG